MLADENSLRGVLVGISISESDDLYRFGLSQVHLRHAFVEIARQLIAAGASLAYGGDLRQKGFTDVLLDLLYTYQRPDRPARDRIRSYLARPIADALTSSDRARLETAARVITVDGPAPDPDLPDELRDRLARAGALSAMRARMAADLDAVVVLGGRTSGFSGRWPGLAEEALQMVVAGKPLYLLGGFGGCARALARLSQGEPVPELTVGAFAAADPTYAEMLPHLGVDDTLLTDRFHAIGPTALHNGLSPAQNETLRGSGDIDEICALLLRGLRTVRHGG